MLNYCNIFQHFNFSFLKKEETKSLLVNACKPNKALLFVSFNAKFLSQSPFLSLPEPYSINN